MLRGMTPTVELYELGRKCAQSHEFALETAQYALTMLPQDSVIYEIVYMDMRRQNYGERMSDVCTRKYIDLYKRLVASQD